jgi:TonB family protein
MKRSLILSCILHVAIIAGLMTFSQAAPKMEGYPTIYRIGLVTLPSKAKRGGQGTQGEATEAKVTMTPKPKVEEKGVTVKEFQKTKPKKKKTKVTPEKPVTPTTTNKPGTADKKPEGKVTQGDEIGDQYGLGNGISAATVDGAGFGSSYYLALVFGKIRDVWDNPVEASATLRVTIYFKILRNGQIIDSQVEKSSGIELFDEAAKRSILTSTPFPPLPTEYTGEYLGIHLEFEYVQ